MKALVKSEIETISSVIVQKPGLFHNEMHPNHIKEYLGDGQLNPEYLLFDDLIDTDLAIKEHNDFTDVIKQISGSKGCIYLDDLINDLSGELLESTALPLPNLIFTRDIAIVAGNLIIVTWANKVVRNRENILSKYIFN